MEHISGYIFTGVVSLIVGFLLQRMQARPKLLYWIPGSFLFQVRNPDVALRTDSLTIQNIGRRPATDIEIIHRTRPDHFQFSTQIDFSEATTPTGEHVIRIPSLGAKEYVNIQLLSHTTQPVLLNVRSAQGRAQLIQVQLQRILPKPAVWLFWLFAFTGMGFVFYWLLSAIIFLSHAIGIVK